MTIAHYALPLWVTLAYIGVYYLFQINQLRVKVRLPGEYKARGEKFDRYRSNDPQMLAADRYVGNALEHMGPFLSLLWLTAVFVSPLKAGIGGAVYVLARASYPFAMGNKLGRAMPVRVMAATIPGYLVLGYFVALLCYAAS